MIGMGNFEANKLYNKADNATKAGNHKEAVYWYDQCLNLTPYDDEAWVGRGLSLILLKQFDEALISFDEAIRIQPNNFNAWICKGECLAIDLDRHEEALECYKIVLNLNQSDYRTWNNQGGSLMKLNRTLEAEASWETALKIKPDYHPARTNLSSKLITRKLMPLSKTIAVIIDKQQKQNCGKEYFYLDETALTFPILLAAPNPTSQTSIPPNAKVIQLQKYKLQGNLTIYSGNIPPEEDWFNTNRTEFCYFAYRNELEPWLKTN
ncbi:MAG: tetratricopeptide repeat protein [Nostoc sp.]|uniref:tetratricopeptide repeat protein n=1 Tax=Nostoc sp. TaxID=1180 RepID=UPI002FF64643